MSLINKSWFRYFITFFYWALLTKLLFSTHPWEAVGGDKIINPGPDPSDPVSSFFMHWGAFLVLAFLLAWSNNFRKTKILVLWFVIAFLYGVFSEFLQTLIPYRFMNIEDICGNVAGVVTICFFEVFKVSQHKEETASIQR